MVNLFRNALFVYFLSCVTLAKKFTKDAIGFPEAEENIKQINKDNRTPVYLPSRCRENELYYPGDQKDDWICDCRPAYLYHPSTDKCWAAFQRGPCSVGQYLALPENSVIPVCMKNPCHVDTYIVWNNTCMQLGSSAPCTDLVPAASALGVNATTLVVGCIKLSIQSRFTEDLPQERCPPGGKRSITSKCSNKI